MGLFDSLFGGRERAARAAEEAGDLAKAAELFADAGKGDEAARVLLLRADAASATEQRLAFAEAAARQAESDEVRQGARRRRALIAFDVLRQRGGAASPSELLRAARELDEVGEHEAAADAFRLAGDTEGEVRALTSAGAIDKLEERLAATSSQERERREADATLRRMQELERLCERKAALELARAHRERVLASGRAPSRDDERIEHLGRGLRERLLRPPRVRLELEGRAREVVLGATLTLGRSEADVVIASRAVSRHHLRLFRGAEQQPMVEDLATRNGTMLRGARLAGAVPVGAGLELMLGGQVRCELTPEPGGRAVVVAVGGAVLLAPLGPLVVGAGELPEQGFSLDVSRDGLYVVARRGPARGFVDALELADEVELAVGDELTAARRGPVVLRVLEQGGGA